MFNSKRMTASLMALVLVVLVAGCGGSTPATTTAPKAVAPTAAPPTTAPAAATSAPAASKATSAPAASTSGGACDYAAKITGPDTADAKALTGAGATFPQPLYTRWYSDYNKLAGVQVNYQGVGSSAGIKQISENTVDFGATDAPMTDDVPVWKPCWAQEPAMQLSTVTALEV